MGFRESNAAHQRTAERSHALEEELHDTRKLVDTLTAESAALEGQVWISTKVFTGYLAVGVCRVGTGQHRLVLRTVPNVPSNSSRRGAIALKLMPR